MNLNATLLAQMIVFLVLVFFIKIFLWPPLIKILDKRKEEITSGLAAAKKSKDKLEAVDHQINQILTESHNQAKQRISDAEKQALFISEEIKNNAKKEAIRIINSAKIDANQQFVQVREALSYELGNLVILGVKQILQREVDAKIHADLLNQLQLKLKL